MSIILRNAVHMSQKTHHEFTMKTDQLILLTQLVVFFLRIIPEVHIYSVDRVEEIFMLNMVLQ